MRTPSALDTLLSIAQRGRPFTAVGGRSFITVRASSLGYRTFPIRSRAFRQWFFDQCYSERDTIPTAHTFAAMLNHLEAQAARDPEQCNIRVPFRVDSRGFSPVPEKILLDLANPDGQFVEITRDGWHTTSGIGVPFETSPSTCSLPVPEPAGDLDPPADSPLEILRRTLNLGPPDGADWLRCLAWLLAALRPGGPYPILILRGPSGCGKSLAGRILRTLVDPSACPFTPLPSSARELLTFARQNWVLAFDHVDTLTLPISGALCRLSSGAGVAFREPRQSEPLQLWIKRPILLTVTDRWEPPPDLAARALTVTLAPLTPDTRRPEHELAKVIEHAFPKILGVLCTAIGHALAQEPPSTRSPTRHADTLAWAEAAAPSLNCTARQMRNAFDAPPPPDPFVETVRALLSPSPRWSGTATALLKLLPSGKSPRALAAQLKKSLLPLADAAIDVQFRRLPGGVRVIHLFASQNLLPPPQLTAGKPLIPAQEVRGTPGFCVTNVPSVEPVRSPLPP